MLTTITAAWLGALLVGPVSAQDIDPIRRGWDAYNGRPYNGCSWLVVSGPEVATQSIIQQAKKAYSEPDPKRLANVAGKVFIEIRTVSERTQGCSNRTMTEVIFVDKESDKPALRLPLESKEAAMSNGFGATWTSNEGLAVGDLSEFKRTLASGKYHVVVVYEDGGTASVGQGAGRTVWSADETRKVR
jgi:hypothetical protein